MKHNFLRMRTFIVLIAVAFAFVNQSCLKDENESDYDKMVRSDDETLSKLLADSTGVKKNAEGFYYKVIAANDSGRSLSRGNVVEFNYKIYQMNGQLVESSTKPAKMKLLWGSIIPDGLDRGISLMKTGESFRFYLPSYLAYGNYKNSKIPVNSNLMVDVSVVNVTSDTNIEVTQLDSIDSYVKSKYPTFEKFASGLYYVDSVTGTGTKPHIGDLVTINFIRRYLDGTVIKSAQDVQLRLGYNNAVQGLEEGIMQMQEGGKAVIVMPASIGFKQSVTILPASLQNELARDGLIRTEVLPYSMIEYTVELKSVY